MTINCSFFFMPDYNYNSFGAYVSYNLNFRMSISNTINYYLITENHYVRSAYKFLWKVHG